MSTAILDVPLPPASGSFPVMAWDGSKFAPTAALALASLALTGALSAASVTVSGLTATRVTYAGASGLLSDDSGFTRTAGALVLDADTDGAYTFGRMRVGLAPSGTSDVAYLGHYDNFDNTNYALSQTAAGQVTINGRASTTTAFRIAGTLKMSLATAALTISSGVPLIVSDTTASTSGTTGSITTAGGIGAAGQITSSSNVTSASRFLPVGSVTTLVASTGSTSIYRTGATGAFTQAGDLCFQTDAVGTRDFLFAAGAVATVVAKILGANGGYQIGADQVIGPRLAGWTAATGTPTRTTFDTATVTLPELAERVKAWIDDALTHGLIGT